MSLIDHENAIDCKIACDCVKRANVNVVLGLCKEILAWPTATHNQTSALPLIVTTMTHTLIPNNRLWSRLAYGLAGQ